MKTIELSKATGSLARYARTIRTQPMVILESGRAIAALIPLSGTDRETLSLGSNERFLSLIERSRSRHEREGGIPTDEMRKRLKKSRSR